MKSDTIIFGVIVTLCVGWFWAVKLLKEAEQQDDDDGY